MPTLILYGEPIMANAHKPLIYSCSGCSNIAQLANQVAIDLDRAELAEMSCIAGIGGNVANIVKQAKNAKQIIALDGCALHCVKNCLANHGISASHHHTLTDYGIKKRKHFDFNIEDVETVKAIVLEDFKVENTETSNIMIQEDT